MSIISETSIPRVRQKIGGRIVIGRYYGQLQKMNPPTTLIKVFRGGWAYELGSTQEEAEVNRAIAEVAFAQTKAMHQVKLTSLKDSKKAYVHTALNLVSAGKKKTKHSESSSSDSSSDEEDETYIEASEDLEDRASMLKTCLRLLCEKYGEDLGQFGDLFAE